MGCSAGVGAACVGAACGAGAAAGTSCAGEAPGWVVGDGRVDSASGSAESGDASAPVSVKAAVARTTSLVERALKKGRFGRTVGLRFLGRRENAAEVHHLPSFAVEGRDHCSISLHACTRVGTGVCRKSSFSRMRRSLRDAVESPSTNSPELPARVSVIVAD